MKNVTNTIVEEVEVGGLSITPGPLLIPKIIPINSGGDKAAFNVISNSMFYSFLFSPSIEIEGEARIEIEPL